MAQVGLRHPVQETRCPVPDMARPQADLQRRVGARHIAEFKTVGAGVDAIRGLRVDLIGERLVGENDSAERIPGPRAGLNRGR